MAVPKSVILCGASGCGKTTLANSLKEEFKFHFVPMRTRILETRFGGRDLINKDPAVRTCFQREVARDTSCLLSEAFRNQKKTGPFVTDRCIDFLMYETLYGTEVHNTLKELTVHVALEYLQHCEEYNARVILLTRNETEINGTEKWNMPAIHQYYTRPEVRKQEITLEAILRLYGIPYTKIQRFLTDLEIKKPIREALRASMS